VVARAWVAELVDADRLSCLDDEALVEAVRAMEDLGRLLDAGRAFAAGVLADRSRKELGASGLAMRHGCKDTGELLERTAGVTPAESRKRIRQSAPLQPQRSVFTGQVGEVAFPLLRAAVGAGLMSADTSAIITGPLAPLLERGTTQEQTWMRTRMRRVEVELAVLALGTQAALDHADVLDHVTLPEGTGTGAGPAGPGRSDPAPKGMERQDDRRWSGRAVSAMMLEAAQNVGATRLPARVGVLRRAVEAFRTHLLARLAATSPSEAQRRMAEHRIVEDQRYVALTPRQDGLWKLDGVLLADTAAQVMLLRDAVLNPRRPHAVTTGTSPGTDADAAAERNTAGVVGKDEHGVPVGSSGRTLPVDEHGLPVDLGDSRSAGQRFHDALGAIMTIAATVPDMPSVQGASPTLVVTATLDQLTDPNGQVFLQGTHQEATSGVDVTLAHHTGCVGTIQKILTTRTGRIVEMTVHNRIYTADQRRAIALRDGGCVWPGCDVPAAWVEIHHVVEWAKGGSTAVDSGCALCFHHHRQLEALAWDVQMRDGIPWLRPPAAVDPERRWIRGQQSAHALYDHVRAHDDQDSSPPTVDRTSAPDVLAACDTHPNHDGRHASTAEAQGQSSCDVGPETNGRSAPRTSESGDTLSDDALFDLAG